MASTMRQLSLLAVGETNEGDGVSLTRDPLTVSTKTLGWSLWQTKLPPRHSHQRTVAIHPRKYLDGAEQVLVDCTVVNQQRDPL